MISFFQLTASADFKCYFAHWLTILLSAQPMMRLQRGIMFHLA